METENKTPKQHDPEFAGLQGWKNPYVIYIGLMVGLFLFLVIAGVLAVKNGWIPTR